MLGWLDLSCVSVRLNFSKIVDFGFLDLAWPLKFLGAAWPSIRLPGLQALVWSLGEGI